MSQLANQHAAWGQLAARAQATPHLRDLFAQNHGRFEAFSVRACGMLADFSKQRWDAATLALLIALTQAQGLEPRRAALFAGDAVNNTEDRPAWHTALRWPKGHTPHPIAAEVFALRDRMLQLAETIRNGHWQGFTGKPISDVVNIGIGGSDLGPAFISGALAPYAGTVRTHFVANVDGRQLHDTLATLDPATTLFIVVSKTFTTVETLQNANTARAWMRAAGCAHSALSSHLLAVTAMPDRALAFGAVAANILPFADWVGGRYSVWGPVGLAVAIGIGAKQFEALLAGAHAMDTHFERAPLQHNLPVLLALAGIWNINFLGLCAHSIAPYHQRLARLPAYLQQLEMESNGKGVSGEGVPLPYATAPIVFGEPGTNGQHAYFQLLHQGSHVVPMDFIAAVADDVGLPAHNAALLGNCIAQSRAFAFGRSQAATDALAAHKTFPGNRPSTTLLLDALTPESLGALIALYEHKVFVQSVVWGINAFDQWGVELGKAMAHEIAQGAIASDSIDSSSLGLLQAALPSALAPVSAAITHT